MTVLPPHQHTIEPGEINRRGCRRCEINAEHSAASGYDTSRIRRQVMSNSEADAVADAVEAGRALARTWFSMGTWGRPHVPDAVALREALQRLGEDRV